RHRRKTNFSCGLVPAVRRRHQGLERSPQHLGGPEIRTGAGGGVASCPPKGGRGGGASRTTDPRASPADLGREAEVPSLLVEVGRARGEELVRESPGID